MSRRDSGCDLDCHTKCLAEPALKFTGNVIPDPELQSGPGPSRMWPIQKPEVPLTLPILYQRQKRPSGSHLTCLQEHGHATFWEIYHHWTAFVLCWATIAWCNLYDKFSENPPGSVVEVK
jgi:hypothetical protein